MNNRKLTPSRGRVAPSSAGKPSKFMRRSSSAGTRQLPAQNMDAATSKVKAVNEIHVEQIDAEAMRGMNPGTHKHSRPDKNRLALPELDTDESSESSSTPSPYPDENTEPETTDEDSIAVNCHTNPSEVIVKGKNVKQIRVKFPPHPPNTEEISGKKSARHRQRRTPSGASLRDDDDKVPYSQEETSLPAISETPVDQSMLSSFPHLNPSDSRSNISLHSHGPVANTGSLYAMTNISVSSMVDWDLKHKHDVLSGLDYFEKKAANFKDLYNQKQREIDMLIIQNGELEEQVKKLKIYNKQIWEEKDELKIKLDANEKENTILQDQAISEWQSRVKSEEMYVELQCDSAKEISAMKEKIAEMSKVGKSVHCATLTMSGDNVDGAHNAKEHSKVGLSDDQFELMHTISRLQDDMRKLNREKDAVVDNNGRLRQDVADAKSVLREKNQELASQQKRFLSLKKSFNDLFDENEKLKMHSRGRGTIQHHSTREQIMNALANSTWPAGNATGRANGEAENVSYIDLPAGSLGTAANGANTFKTPTIAHPTTNMKSRRGSIGTKIIKGPVTTVHKRAKSDVISLSENLPPVANPTR